MTTDAFDDLIGRTETPQTEIDELCKQVASGRGTFVDRGELKRPVSQNFLALVFDMDAATVGKRLLAVKPVGYGGTAKQPRPLYDFKEACSYLVEPRIDIEAYIRSLDVNKLPNHINKIFWEAQRIKLKYKLEAGQAWRSEDVLEVFGSVFMLIKDRVQLWSENMREAVRLTDDQVVRFTQMTDDLQSDLHRELVKIPETRSTPSMAVADEGESSPE